MQVWNYSSVLMVFLILKFVCQVLVQAQLIKSEPQLNPATVMYTAAPVADVTVTSSGTPTPAPTSIHTLVNTAHGAILATGEFCMEVTVTEICDLMFNFQRPPSILLFKVTALGIFHSS